MPEAQVQSIHATGVLPVYDVPALIRHAEAAGPQSWLAEPLIPAGTYGVLGAPDKAGKTWAMVDLAVSVVTGTPWLGRFSCGDPGRVLACFGEGGAHGLLRRLRVIVRGRGGDDSDLEGLRVITVAPRLNNRAHLDELTAELRAFPPRVVLIDPMYLSVAGAKGSDLYAMGELLGAVQAMTQDVGAALILYDALEQDGHRGRPGAVYRRGTRGLGASARLGCVRTAR